jgi:hypothetical protein
MIRSHKREDNLMNILKSLFNKDEAKITCHADFWNWSKGNENKDIHQAKSKIFSDQNKEIMEIGLIPIEYDFH